MADLIRGLKAGIVAGIIYSIVNSIVSLLLLYESNSSSSMFSGSSMYVFAILASIPFSIIGGVIIGFITGLIFAAAYHVLPGSSSIIKGIVVALLLWLILSILPILILGSYLTGSYSSSFEITILNALILYLFFGFLLGFFWDRFGHMKRCSNCDKEIPLDSHVCAYCGHSIESYSLVAPSVVPSEQISKKDNTALIVGLIVAVIVIGIILSFATFYMFLEGWTNYDYSSQDNEIYPVSSSLFIKENDTLQITNSYPDSTWDDIIVSSGEAMLPSGTVDEGDTISHCSGTVVLRWASTNTVLGVWSFSETMTPKNDTVAYWQFNEGNGEIVHDSSGNNLDGAVENGVWINRGDSNETALSFSSSASKYVLVTDSSLFDLDTFMISAEFKPSSDIDAWPEGYQSIVAKEHQYILRFFGEYGTGRHGISAIYFYGGSSYNAVTVYLDELDSQFQPKIKQWNTISMSYDGSYLKLYQNGLLLGQKKFSSSIYHPAFSTYDLYIGSHLGYDRFIGEIDNVMIKKIGKAQRNISFYLYVGGSNLGNYSHIQDAIDASADGDTIYVYNGTYHENIRIGKSIYLIGTNKNTTIIDGNNGSKYAVTITGESVSLSGFTIQNSHLELGGGIIIYSHGNNISYNIIKNNENGININSRPPSSCLSHNNIFNNMIINNKFIGIGAYDISYSNIKNNTISENGAEGICMRSSSSNNVVSNNIIINNKGIGIYLMSNSNNNKFSGNNITKNSGGISLQFYCNYNNLSRNRIIGNDYEGIYLQDCSNNIINKNNISQHGQTGIHLNLHSSNNKIFSNDITKNNYGIFLYPIQYTNNNQIYHNNFIDNIQNVYGKNNSYINASICDNIWDDGEMGNFWSDYNGTDNNHDGIGDTSYHIPGIPADEDRYPLIRLYQ